MSYADDLRRFQAKVHDRQRRIFLVCLDDVHDSVTIGSPITGAPGQPVDTEFLRGSWQKTFPGDWVGQTATGAEYAKSIEDGQQPPYQTAGGTPVSPGPMTLRSAVGGFHSVKLTRGSWDLVVRDVVREEVGAG